MKHVTREEREWLLRSIARGLLDYMNSTEPPIPVAELHRHPPGVYDQDFGVVEIYTKLWDATFIRPLNKPGGVYIRIDLPPEKRRYALARETLFALVSSKHGRKLGLPGIFMPTMDEDSAYFAGHLLAPDAMIKSIKKNSPEQLNIAETFCLPEGIAAKRFIDTL